MIQRPRLRGSVYKGLGLKGNTINIGAAPLIYQYGDTVIILTKEIACESAYGALFTPLNNRLRRRRTRSSYPRSSH